MSQVYVGNGNGGGGGAHDYHVARYIVSAGGASDGANFTTIAAAYTAATLAGAPQTVFLQPGTYTENITLAPGINLAAFDCDAQYSSPNVIISGKLSATFSGEMTISGIALQTNGDYCLEITGTNSTTIIFSNAQIRATNHNAIHANTSGGAGMSFFTSTGNIIGNFNFFTCLTSGGVNIYAGCTFARVSGTIIADTFDNVSLNVNNSIYQNPIVMSGNSNGFNFENSFNTNASVTTITINNTTGGDSNHITNSRVESGSAPAISIGAGASAKVSESDIFSNNTNAITGAGTLNYGHITFTGGSSGVNVATQNALPVLPAAGGGGIVTLVADDAGTATGTNVTVSGGVTGLTTTASASTLDLEGILNGASGGTGLDNTGLTIDLSGGVPGYVMTSDPSGNGTWEPAGAGGSATAFYAYSSTTTTNNNVMGGAAPGPYTVQFDSTHRNDGGAFNTATGLYTAPTTGFYHFTGVLYFNSSAGFTAGTEVLAMSIGSVQSQVFYQQLTIVASNSSMDICLPYSFDMQMTTGDTIGLSAFCDNALQNVSLIGAPTSTSPFNTYCSFSGFFVGS